MAIGYACLTIGVKDCGLKGLMLRNASKERLEEVAAHNLKALENMIAYNIRNGIGLFRISSDIIPFASHEVNTLEWWSIYDEQLKRIGEKIKSGGMRVSMHPGQYTVLNSPDEDIVARAKNDLLYHTRFLDSLGTGSSNKVILHLGGIYGNKKEAVKRFMKNYADLPEAVKKRLVIENDEKSYNIVDVLEVGRKCGIPVVFDNLHHELNLPYKAELTHGAWIGLCKETWKPEDGRQKMHYSQQLENGKTGAHSKTIAIRPFMDFYKEVNGKDIDIMLEVKDKNISALKCHNCTSPGTGRKQLEEEWERYKYLVLERSNDVYMEIESMFREKSEIDAVSLYSKIEDSLSLAEDRGSAASAAHQIWSLLKKAAKPVERKRFGVMLSGYESGTKALNDVKKYLAVLAERYETDYLLESYYFMEY